MQGDYERQEDYYSEEQFEERFLQIKKYLTNGHSSEDEKCTIILGGQPGAGKSTYYNNYSVDNFVIINGDDFRRFHPNFLNIVSSDIEHMAERTQRFSNAVVERLIRELSQESYNLIIEGTLRNPDVPIRTCKDLNSKGYKTDLVVVACDAELAWKSTIIRAENMIKNKQPARLVPIDIYDYTVNHIAENLEKVEKEKCFDNIKIINRDGNTLYDSKSSASQSGKEILLKELNLDNWNEKYPQYEKDFIEIKINILQQALKEKNNKKHR